MGPSLGALELEHIARGIATADALLKRAEIELLTSCPVSGGKHFILLRGEVAEVEEAMASGRERAGESLVDSLYLPLASESLWRLVPELDSNFAGGQVDQLSVAIVETSTMCAALECADASCKTAPVELRDLRLGSGIGGKAFFTMAGELCDIEAAVECAVDRAGARLLSSEIIAAPANDLAGKLVF